MHPAAEARRGRGPVADLPHLGDVLQGRHEAGAGIGGVDGAHPGALARSVLHRDHLDGFAIVDPLEMIASADAVSLPYGRRDDRLGPLGHCRPHVLLTLRQGVGSSDHYRNPFYKSLVIYASQYLL